MIRYIFILLVIVSCKDVQKKDAPADDDQRLSPKDTVVLYNIEGISTEGAEVEVNYILGKISKSETIVYGETGKAIIVYDFEPERIKVAEMQYSYLTDLENVNSDDDLQLTNEQSYYIDYDGNVIGEPINDRVDIFKEFIDVIPLSLN